ncbi:MerR family transcriptional regulator [Paenibacillus sp. HN-1]|nr:MerR family transcriptional regulator [Paenibacillus sp. CGMCC 1.18879]MBY9082612.1 MerR family transcriptional regulator [Paenibacillus sp. CGMCC 1.18879]MBY9085660.1 MerR family transcriptional regulator [Paenibacillus sinensis]
MLKSQDISQILGIKEVTVRKYVGELEKAGYSVFKSEGGHRQYTEQDATVLRHMKTLCDSPGMTVQLAAKVVASKYSEAHEIVAPAVISPDSGELVQYEKRYSEMLEIVRTLAEQNQQQAAQMDKLHERMEDQNANITAVLREIQQARREIAAAKARKWWKFWIKEATDGPDPEAAWKRKQDPEDYIK